MKRTVSVSIVACGILVVATVTSLVVGSRSKGKAKPAVQRTYRVGVLSGLDFFAPTLDGFKTGLADLGYIEGTNISYDVQKTNFDIAAYDGILRKFVADKVDLIFVFPTEATQEAKTITQGTGIPVVFTNAFTEDTNIVANIREPGGNITGVRWPGPDLALQRFETLHEMVPHASRMWIPYQKGYPIVKSQLEALRPAFAAAGMTLMEIPASNTTELGAELQQQAKSFNKDTDAILLIAEPLLTVPDNFAVLGAFADEHNIPIGGTMESVQGHETLFGIIPQNVPQGKQAAFLADKIFKGIPAGTLPVVSAESYLQVNYKAAQKAGITVPQDLLNRANEIIR